MTRCPRCGGGCRIWLDGDDLCYICGWTGDTKPAPPIVKPGNAHRPMNHRTSVKASGDRLVYRREISRRHRARIKEQGRRR